MPIYEYQCKHCDHQFDLMQKINDMPVKQCPLCLKEEAVRLVSAAGFQLKGDGWYATDFKNKGSKETKDSSKNAEPKAESKKTDAGSDSAKKESAPSAVSKESND